MAIKKTGIGEFTGFQQKIKTLDSKRQQLTDEWLKMRIKRNQLNQEIVEAKVARNSGKVPFKDLDKYDAEIGNEEEKLRAMNTQLGNINKALEHAREVESELRGILDGSIKPPKDRTAKAKLEWQKTELDKKVSLIYQY